MATFLIWQPIPALPSNQFDHPGYTSGVSGELAPRPVPGRSFIVSANQLKQRPSSPLVSHPKGAARGVISEVSPCTPEERLERIEQLAQRIAAHVQFMCGPGSSQVSAEAKEKALAAFYAGMIAAEHVLGKIHEGLLLV
jgi:hypothetical protein